MGQMISVASGFQYSVNIGFDLNNDEKLKNFIPTKSALQLLKDILQSTLPQSNERARILIGAYGKGKSHIVLTILSILMKRDMDLFRKLLPKLEEDPELKQLVRNYYDTEGKILPVIITGSNTSLTQAFLLALQRTLSQTGMSDVMPETNYKAAVATIRRWKEEYPATFEQLKEKIQQPIEKFISSLEDYDNKAYELFERVYPALTSGSLFNPFLGFDVIDLYESAAKGLKSKGYSGIYVVYDEFSKFLEANITQASVSDTKMLQDFAEMCNRSGNSQMHLMLISHKEIANYIDKLPKMKVDGWRGVSERFLHVHLNNNFTQTYEIIASAIQKKPELWDEFRNSHKQNFDDLLRIYSEHTLFVDMDASGVQKTVEECYPLHPVSTYILPRLSEKVAQNERTLFTFLSADVPSTLRAFLRTQADEQFSLVTPDWIYDYFEPLLRKEVYAGSIHDTFVLASIILTQIGQDTLQAKIVKTIALIYMLEQYERIKPTKDEVIQCFRINYEIKDIDEAIDDLIENKYLVYLKRSNGYLQLKQSSGVDIWQMIHDTVEAQTSKISVKDILNQINFDSYIYPSRYNDEKQMTRYFSFLFIDGSEAISDVDWEVKSENIDGDGVIYAVVPENSDAIDIIRTSLLYSSKRNQRFIFVLPKEYTEISSIVREFYAVSRLKDEAYGDPVLFDEYEVIYEDLHDVVTDYIRMFTHPESGKALYIHDGAVKTIFRKANLTGLASEICFKIFNHTPRINNEMINKDVITSTAQNSSRKIVAALLRNQLEHNLGLIGTSQEVSIMRSTLTIPHVLIEVNDATALDLNPDNTEMSNMLNVIKSFIENSKDGASFSLLYERLTKPEHGIGLRRGLIPIFLAAVIHEYKQQIVIRDASGQLPINADVLLQINYNPNAFSLALVGWSEDKANYVAKLEELFKDYIVDAEKEVNVYDFVTYAMRRWYMALPKFARECQIKPDNTRMKTRYIEWMRLLRRNEVGYDLLFSKIPRAFNHMEDSLDGLDENVSAAKDCYDSLLDLLDRTLIESVKATFVQTATSELRTLSLRSVIEEWCAILDPLAFEQIFSDGTDKCLSLFKDITDDDITFIRRLAKLCTGLRVEDWDDSTIARFNEMLNRYKETAEGFHAKKDGGPADTTQEEISGYQLSYLTPEGEKVTKRFDRINVTTRANLLRRRIVSVMGEMGQAISEQEKRQILVDVLKDLC